MSATDAASGGATGLPAEGPSRPSVFRRHPLATGIAAGTIAVILVSGLTAWGVGAAVTASLTSATSETPMAMPSTAPTTAPAAGGKTAGGKAAGRLAFRATIQSIGSGSWTILTKKGQTVTVTIDGSTQFGTRKAAATASDFAVGDSVVVVATRGTVGTPTATRIAELPAGGAGA